MQSFMWNEIDLIVLWFLNAVDCVIHVQTFMNFDYIECQKKKCNENWAQNKAIQIAITHNDAQANDEAQQ